MATCPKCKNDATGRRGFMEVTVNCDMCTGGRRQCTRCTWGPRNIRIKCCGHCNNGYNECPTCKGAGQRKVKMACNATTHRS
ncbi:hypothetical protein C7999DRAFT_13121 [Corynascus novoguineensis]|uniref:Uncharacterized protein n=1 Tax=Corynascus novoguineensis TaxID=1126955 RepID=A0AAN7CY38_9PEZI|nr:hypothetical protein C7999DRAFT_13121 [Corynascus novoguineensis]